MNSELAPNKCFPEGGGFNDGNVEGKSIGWEGVCNPGKILSVGYSSHN